MDFVGASLEACPKLMAFRTIGKIQSYASTVVRNGFRTIWSTLLTPMKSQLEKKECVEKLSVVLGRQLTINSVNFLDTPIRDGCSIKINKPVDNKLKSSCQTGGLEHGFKPINFSSNSYNFLNAIRARVTCPLLKPDEKEVMEFTKWYKKNKKFFFGGMRGVTSLSFDEYIKGSNASPEVKKVLIRVKKELDERFITEKTKLSSLDLRRWTTRKTFLKVENLLYRSRFGVLKKAPRVINGAQPEFVDLTGPWFAAFSKRLKKIWNVNNFITYSSGLSAEKIGHWAYKRKLWGHWAEDDVSKWDVSVRKYLLLIEADIYKYCGAPLAVNQLVRANIKTRSKSRFGISYTTPDGRKSGDPYTSCGNSILNALLHCYIYQRATGITIKQIPQHLQMIVQGDDNALVAKHQVDYKKIMEKLGFKAETKHREHLYDVSFCSARFTPVSNGAVLLPNPSRVYMKFGTFATNKLINYEELCSVSAKGLYNTLSFIPLFKNKFDKCIALCPNAKERKMDEWQVWCNKPVKPSPETWVWLDKYFMGIPLSEKETIPMERFLELGTDAPTLYFKTIDPKHSIQSDNNGLVCPIAALKNSTKYYQGQ